MYLFIGAVVVVLIVATVTISAIQQKKDRDEQVKQRQIHRRKSIIATTDDVLMAATEVPISAQMNIILLNRIRHELLSLSRIDPSSEKEKHRISELDKQISNREKRKIAEGTEEQHSKKYLKADNEAHAKVMLLNLKKLRAILQSEFKGGRVTGEVLAEEDQKLQIMQLQVNISLLVERSQTARKGGLGNSANRYLNKAVEVLEAQPFECEYITETLPQIHSMLQSLCEEAEEMDSIRQDRKKKTVAAEREDEFSTKKW